MNFTDDTPLGEVIAWVREQAAGRGAHCPACERNVKIYKRSINAGMARSLVVMYRDAGTEWTYVPGVVGAKSREEGKLAYWGLAEEKPARRPDGGHGGWWRLTVLGARFARGEVAVPKYAYVYNRTMLRLDGPLVTIHDCARNRFNLAELMAAS